MLFRSHSEEGQKILKPVKAKGIIIVNSFSTILAFASCCSCHLEYLLLKPISLTLDASSGRHPFFLPLIPLITVVGKFLG